MTASDNQGGPAMTITNIPGADEKNAKLSLKLRADSGYSANSDGHLVSANQWAAIISICEDTATGKALMAAPELLQALQDIVRRGTSRGPADDRALIAAKSAIAKATGASS